MNGLDFIVKPFTSMSYLKYRTKSSEFQKYSSFQYDLKGCEAECLVCFVPVYTRFSIPSSPGNMNTYLWYIVAEPVVHYI